MTLFHIADNTRTWSAYIILMALLSAFAFGSLIELPLDTHEDEIFRDHLAADGPLYFFQAAEQKEFSAPGRPLTELFRWFGYLLWGNDVGLFHLYCAAVHTLASLLLALTARRLGAPLDLSLLGGLLFLLNVSHFRGVHYISGLDYPLAQVWSLVAVVAYVRFLSARQWVWLLATGTCLVLGTASHQAAVMVLPFLFYWSWARGETLREMLPPLVVLGCVLLLEIYLLLQITDIDGATTSLSLRQLLISSPLTTIPAMGRVLLWLVGRLFTTAHWIFFPLYQQQSWELYFGGLTLAGLVLLVYYRATHLAVWSAWIVLSLVPFIMVSEEIHLHLVHGPSRHLYMASAGSSMLLAWVLQRAGCALVQRWASAGYAIYGLALVAVCASGYACLKKTEALSHYATGRFYIAGGDLPMGIAQLERAIAQGGDILPLEDAYYRLCSLKLATGADVEEDLTAALNALPESLRLRLLFHVLESLSDDVERRRRGAEGVREIGRSIEEIERFNARAMTAGLYYNVGKGIAQNGDWQRAIEVQLRALEFDHSRADIFLLLGLAYSQVGQQKNAVQVLARALELASQNADMHVRVGMALFDMGLVDAASTAYEKALNINADHAIAHVNLGWILYEGEFFAEATEHYRAALVSQPSAAALYNLGLAYLAQGNIAAARSTYVRAVGQFGAPRGVQIGAAADLRALAARSAYGREAREILAKHWGE